MRPALMGTSRFCASFLSAACFWCFSFPFHMDLPVASVPSDGCSTHGCPALVAGGRRCWQDPAPREGVRCLRDHRALFQPYFPPWTIGTRLGGCSLLCQHLAKRDVSAMGSALALGPK